MIKTKQGIDSLKQFPVNKLIMKTKILSSHRSCEN